MFRALFFLSIMLLVFLWGGLSVSFGFFPHSLFEEARIAWDALNEVAEEEIIDSKPSKFEELVPEGGENSPVATSFVKKSSADNDLILINGGYFQLMSECPTFGCLAWIIDRDGNVRHTWEIDPQAVWGDVERISGFNKAENIYPAGMHLYDNGDLLVIFQARNTFPYAVGIAKFDKNSSLLWEVESLSHHWLSVDDEGLIYAPSLNPVDSPMKIGNTSVRVACKSKKVYEDMINVYTPDGKLVKKISVTKALIESGYSGLVYEGNQSKIPEYDECDPTHLNDVKVLTKEMAPEYPGLNAGDLLVSMRNNNTIAVIDGKTNRVKKTVSGKSILQHSPIYAGNNKVVLFDNLGGDAEHGGSRILKIDLTTEKDETLFPQQTTPKDVDFITHNGGRVVLSSGQDRALVSLTRRGRILEVDLVNGKVLWEYLNSHSLDDYLGSKGLEKIGRAGRFTVSGAYYVTNATFIDN